MESVRITFAPVWSWPWMTAAIVVMLTVVLWTYPPRVRHLPPSMRRLLISLRLLAMLALIFAMLRPALQFEERDKRGALLIVAMDASKSMTTHDETGTISRREALVRTLTDNAELLDELSETVEIQYLDFDTEIAPTDAPTLESDGAFTGIGKVIDEMREAEPSKTLVGVVLMSDGAQRAVGDDDADPRAAASRFFAQRRTPIHTVVYGEPVLTGVGLDLALEDMIIPPEAFERKTVPVRAQLRATGAADRRVRVRLLIEDRTGLSLGQSGPMREIPLPAAEIHSFREIDIRDNNQVINVDLAFIADQAGEYKLAMEVVPLEGETKRNNNIVQTLITVRQGGLRVALFDTGRPEQKSIRLLNQTAKIQVDLQTVNSGDFAGNTRIDPSLFDPGIYDVYIIGDVHASMFELQGNRNLLDDLADRVNEGAGLLMLGGVYTFSAGGYADSPIADLIPVGLDSGDAVPLGETPPGNLYIGEQLQMLPTPDGESHYLMQIAGGDLREGWLRLPKLVGAVRLEPRNANIEVLAESEEGQPLLLATDSGGGRVAAFAAFETWRWVQHGQRELHQRFWQQLVLWLARKEFDSDQPIWCRIQPRNFAPLATAPIEFGARDENGQPVADARFEVEVLSPDAVWQTVPSALTLDGGLAEFADTAEAGDYWVRVKGQLEGEDLGLPAMGRFLVDARDIEMDNPVADPDLMREIAKLTSTNPIESDEFGDFVSRLIAEGHSADLVRYRHVQLWDGWPLLAVFVSLLTLEWVLRKRRGLV
jgi:uncharacterized membrane protein